MNHRTLASSLALALGLSALGCSVDEVPEGLRRTPPGDGPTVRFDLYHKPLPDIPLPNDSATWPDPTSRTGLRVNASIVAPTEIEATARKKFDSLEGWGTYAPITIAFDKKPGQAGAAIDLANVVKRHQGDDYELADDAVYVVNLDTGVPAIVDVTTGTVRSYVVAFKVAEIQVPPVPPGTIVIVRIGRGRNAHFLFVSVT